MNVFVMNQCSDDRFTDGSTKSDLKTCECYAQLSNEKPDILNLSL